MAKRLKRHQNEIFTFVPETEVPFDNNLAERMIRLGVIMRKHSLDNRSQKGAGTQSALVSVFVTLKQRDLNPIDTVIKARRIHSKTGNLPLLC